MLYTSSLKMQLWFDFCLIWIVATNLQHIHHRFPETGHSSLPCDRNSARIEKQKRHVYLYLHDESQSLTQNV